MFAEYPDITQFDILVWWKKKSITFPIIFAIAKDLLTIPISLVACEQVFNISGNVLDEERFKLKVNILEALMCVKDWEFAQHSYQQNQED